MELMVIVGLGLLFVKAITFLLIIGIGIWLLAELGGVIFKLLCYGCVTVLSLIGLIWLFV